MEHNCSETKGEAEKLDSNWRQWVPTSCNPVRN